MRRQSKTQAERFIFNFHFFVTWFQVKTFVQPPPFSRRLDWYQGQLLQVFDRREEKTQVVFSYSSFRHPSSDFLCVVLHWTRLVLFICATFSSYHVICSRICNRATSKTKIENMFKKSVLFQSFMRLFLCVVVVNEGWKLKKKVPIFSCFTTTTIFYFEVKYKSVKMRRRKEKGGRFEMIGKEGETRRRRETITSVGLYIWEKEAPLTWSAIGLLLALHLLSAYFFFFFLTFWKRPVKRIEEKMCSDFLKSPPPPCPCYYFQSTPKYDYDYDYQFSSFLSTK